jgi:hypothetical protein
LEGCPNAGPGQIVVDEPTFAPPIASPPSRASPGQSTTVSLYVGAP